MDVTLTVSGRKITLPQNFPAQLTNTEKIDRVKFQCDAEYDGFSLVAVFRNGERGKTYPVTVPADRGFVDVDPRALRRAGHLYIGMFGINGLKVLPTAWSAAIELTEGTATDALDDEETAHVLPGIYERIDALDDAVEELEDAVDGLDVAVEELDEAVDQLDADVDALETTVAGKQDTIADLDTIRSGAAAGATALQSVPIASADNIGGAKFQDYWGIGIFSDGRTYVAPATGNQITFRNNNNRPITPYNMDTAFRTCITDPAQELTGEQKAAACATIGAEYKGVDNWVLVAELDREQTAFTVNLEGYTELMVLSAIEGNTSTHLLYNNGKLLINSAGINGKRAVKAEYKNYGWGGFAPIVCTRAGAIDNPTDCICDMGLAYGRMDNFTISDITNIYLSNTPTVYAHVEIYAR